MSLETDIIGEILRASVHGAQVDAGMDALAAECVEQVKELTPVFGDRPPHRGAPADGNPGDARNAVVAEIQTNGDRRVISRDKKAIWIEIGTAHMPEYAPFTKVAALHRSTTGPSFSSSGRDSMADEGVHHAHEHLRGEVERLAKYTATGVAAHRIVEATKSVKQARITRSAAFKAARPRRGRRG